jgi:hypothetical protein
MFSVVDTLLIRPLPFPGGDRLVAIASRAPDEPRGLARFTAPAIRELRAEVDIFSAVEGYQFGAGTITGDGDPQLVASPQLSAGLMRLLGVRPLVGRVFVDADAMGAVPVAIISERLWRGRYGADPQIVNRTLTMDGIGYQIVGVACCGANSRRLAC